MSSVYDELAEATHEHSTRHDPVPFIGNSPYRHRSPFDTRYYEQLLPMQPPEHFHRRSTWDILSEAITPPPEYVPRKRLNEGSRLREFEMYGKRTPGHWEYTYYPGTFNSQGGEFPQQSFAMDPGVAPGGSSYIGGGSPVNSQQYSQQYAPQYQYSVPRENSRYVDREYVVYEKEPYEEVSFSRARGGNITPLSNRSTNVSRTGNYSVRSNSSRGGYYPGGGGGGYTATPPRSVMRSPTQLY